MAHKFAFNVGDQLVANGFAGVTVRTITARHISAHDGRTRLYDYINNRIGHQFPITDVSEDRILVRVESGELRVIVNVPDHVSLPYGA